MTAAPDPGAVGERIEALLEASAVGGPVARERAEELLRLVVDLYGAGLERVLELTHDAGALDDALLSAMADDHLVSSLLLIHGLHPYGVEDRVQRALDDVRPYLGSHGGDVRLLEVTDEGVVRLELLGSCDGCASSAVTLELAVDDAVRAAAPEVVAIEVEEKTPSVAGLISVDSLTARLRAEEQVTAAGGGVHWAPAARLDELAVGGVLPTTVDGTDLVLLRLLSGVYAYRDALRRLRREPRRRRPAARASHPGQRGAHLPRVRRALRRTPGRGRPRPAGPAPRPGPAARA